MFLGDGYGRRSRKIVFLGGMWNLVSILRYFGKATDVGFVLFYFLLSGLLFSK